MVLTSTAPPLFTIPGSPAIGEDLQPDVVPPHEPRLIAPGPATGGASIPQAGCSKPLEISATFPYIERNSTMSDTAMTPEAQTAADDERRAIIAKLIAETGKLTAETAKINSENRWYPLVLLHSPPAPRRSIGTYADMNGSPRTATKREYAEEGYCIDVSS